MNDPLAALGHTNKDPLAFSDGEPRAWRRSHEAYDRREGLYENLIAELFGIALI